MGAYSEEAQLFTTGPQSSLRAYIKKVDTNHTRIETFVLVMTYTVNLIIWYYQIKSCSQVLAPLSICSLKTWVDYGEYLPTNRQHFITAALGTSLYTESAVVSQ